MTLKETMGALESLGTETGRKVNERNGSPDQQFGVKMGDIRNLGKKIKVDPKLAAELWKTGNYDAMLLATLLMKPKELSAEELDQLVRSIPHRQGMFMSQLSSWLTENVVRNHPEKEKLRAKWMKDKDPMAARTGWTLTTDLVRKNPDGLDLEALLNRIEKEAGKAAPHLQWSMNHCLAEIGINFPSLRKRAIAIGEKLEMFKDFPVSKGCVSPYAPIWISEMLARKK